jgi:hypothetical protein
MDNPISQNPVPLQRPTYSAPTSKTLTLGSTLGFVLMLGFITMFVIGIILFVEIFFGIAASTSSHNVSTDGQIHATPSPFAAGFTILLTPLLFLIAFILSFFPKTRRSAQAIAKVMVVFPPIMLILVAPILWLVGI